MPRPSPRLPPVTMTLRIVPRQLAAGRERQRRDEADGGGHFVPRELPDAQFDDFPPQALGVGSVVAVEMLAQYHVGNHDRPGDRVAARVHQRKPYRRMAVDHRLYFLRMDLETAYVDDAPAPADEIITLATQLHHVVGVDEAVGAGDRRGAVPERADPLS